jgi:hypothetical protein
MKPVVSAGSNATSLRPPMLVAAAAIAFSANDPVFKLLSGTYPLHEMMAVRSAVALALVTLFMSTRAGGFRRCERGAPPSTCCAAG